MSRSHPNKERLLATCKLSDLARVIKLAETDALLEARDRARETGDVPRLRRLQQAINRR